MDSLWHVFQKFPNGLADGRNYPAACSPAPRRHAARNPTVPRPVILQSRGTRPAACSPATRGPRPSTCTPAPRRHAAQNSPASGSATLHAEFRKFSQKQRDLRQSRHCQRNRPCVSPGRKCPRDEKRRPACVKRIAFGHLSGIPHHFGAPKTPVAPPHLAHTTPKAPGNGSPQNRSARPWPGASSSLRRQQRHAKSCT